MSNEDVSLSKAVLPLKGGEGGSDVKDVVWMSGIAKGGCRGGGGILGKFRMGGEAVINAGEAVYQGIEGRPWPGSQEGTDRRSEPLQEFGGITPGTAVNEPGGEEPDEPDAECLDGGLLTQPSTRSSRASNPEAPRRRLSGDRGLRTETGRT